MSSGSITSQQESVLKEVREKDITVIRLWFTDILGQIKGFAISTRELEMAFERGMGFDGSSIEGFARIHESDLMAHPDPATFTILNTQQDYTAARMFCDFKHLMENLFQGIRAMSCEESSKGLKQKATRSLLDLKSSISISKITNLPIYSTMADISTPTFTRSEPSCVRRVSLCLKRWEYRLNTHTTKSLHPSMKSICDTDRRWKWQNGA